MPKTISEYQEAFKSIVEKLKSKQEILAILVFGSVINGDLWEHSDIDLIVIDNEVLDNEVTNVYTDENEVPIHIRLVGKKRFIYLCKGHNKGGHMHRLFCSSKLAFSRDKEIDSLYNEERYYNEFHGEKWNMTYFSQLLKSVAECKKYLQTDSIYNAYTIANIAFRNYAELVVNHSGYMINRDIVNMAMKLDNELQIVGQNFFDNKNNLKDAIQNLISYIEINIKKNITSYASVVINYMKEKDMPLSSREIANSNLFRDYKVNMEEVLEELYSHNIIKKMKMPLKRKDGSSFIKENVYYI